MTNTLIHGIIDALSGSVSKEVIVFLILNFAGRCLLQDRSLE